MNLRESVWAAIEELEREHTRHGRHTIAKVSTALQKALQDDTVQTALLHQHLLSALGMLLPSAPEPPPSGNVKS